MAIVKDLGMVTAYAYAVAGGYEGTEAEFEEMLGQAGITLEQLENLTAVATTLSEGSEATASYSEGVLTFGIPRGNTGATGPQGPQGAQGDTGNGIASIAKTGTSGLVDTYTITFTDGTTTTFEVTNGEDGTVTPEQVEQAIADALATFSGGTYENMTVGNAEQLLSTQYAEDSAPYLFRPTGGSKDVGNREYDEIVGGSVVVNQLVNKENYEPSKTEGGITITNNDDGSISVSGTATQVVTSQIAAYAPGILALNHKYLVITGITGGSLSTYEMQLYRWGSAPLSYDAYHDTIIDKPNENASSVLVRIAIRSGVTVDLRFKPQIIDLTKMFGATIADYAYTLEQSTDGSGIAWLKSYGFFGTDYIAYNAGTLAHVSGLTAHIMRDANNNVIGNYALDSSLTLRGIPKLADGQMYYDGDVYAHDGSVTRKYGIVDLGSLSYTRAQGSTAYYFRASVEGWIPNNLGMTCPLYTVVQGSEVSTADKQIGVNGSGQYLYIRNDSYTDAASFKTAMSGVMLLYKLTTATTETATAYQSPQICDPDGTEEYTGSAIPVGHNTQYPADLKGAIERVMVQVPEPPTANGAYTLKCTVSASGASYAWTADT